jgi:hypothetical protein
LAFAPWHVQIYDLKDPEREGASEREAKITAIRERVNAAIAGLSGGTTVPVDVPLYAVGNME